MQNIIYGILLLTSVFMSVGSAQTHSKETIEITTSLGTVKLKLFEETPLHKANFLNIVKSGFYDSLLFHRVISNFMIQGGDPLSKTAKAGDSLGHGDFGKPVPAEFREGIIHQKGRLCAARESDAINPRRESSACQFYVVVGKARSREELKALEKKKNDAERKRAEARVLERPEYQALSATLIRLKQFRKDDSVSVLLEGIREPVNQELAKTAPFRFTEQQLQVYSTLGGTPHLDGAYTVFGEVIEGQEVIDKISMMATDARDRPLDNIRMRITVVSPN